MASSDIQPLLDTQPPNLPFNVARVTADGRPTSHLIDWENFTSNWFRSNIVKTDQRIDSVKAVADDAMAAVTVETNARVSADEALAEQITTVEASVDDATANGQIYFGAMAGPAGSVAAYGVFLTAGNTYAGMQIIAESGGGASIGFAANDFRLTDSGTAQNVFTYTGGVFTFNVPVRVQTIDIAQQAVTTPTTAFSSGATISSTGGSWQTLLVGTLTGGSGYALIVNTEFEYKAVTASGTVNGQWRVLKDGGAVIRNGTLGVFAEFNPVYVSKLDVNIPSTHTYEFQVFVSSTGSATFQFANISFFFDLRKR